VPNCREGGRDKKAKAEVEVKVEGGLVLQQFAVTLLRRDL